MIILKERGNKISSNLELNLEHHIDKTPKTKKII
jgi:hypothetical protein